MKFLKFPGLLFLIMPAIVASDSHCKNGICEKTSLFLANDKKQNSYLVGYVIETFSSLWNWKQCFHLCLKNCQCLSFNFNEVNATENCELNDANTKLEPEALREKEGVNYYELARNYYDLKVGKLIPIHLDIGICAVSDDQESRLVQTDQVKSRKCFFGK